MKTYYLYYLLDPNTDIVRYVGITYRPKTRFNEHLNKAKKLKTHKDKWIMKLLNNNQKPIFKIVSETQDIYEIFEREINAIANVRDLTNSTTGGEYFTFTSEVINKLKEKRQNQPIHIWTQEEKNKLSLAHLGVPKNEAWKKNIGLGAKYRQEVIINGVTYSSIKEVMRELKVGFKKAQSFVTK